MRKQIKNQNSKIKNAFTLIELLVVVGIIAVLISILVPVVSRVRISGQTAATKAFISTLTAAIERYHGDFRAYPGPVPNSVYGVQAASIGPQDQVESAQTSTIINGKLTGSENLVLGLLGGLDWENANRSFATNGTVQYKKSELGRGPVSLNANLQAARRYNAYADATNLSTGNFKDPAGMAADDTDVPEFLDSYSSAMPLIYLRARPGFQVSSGATLTNDLNNVVYDALAAGANSGAPYNLAQAYGYTKSDIGEGKSPNKSKLVSTAPPYKHGLQTVTITKEIKAPKGDAKYSYPYDAYAYLVNPTSVKSPRSAATFSHEYARQKDSYILISAGPDRIYGTEDDIANFGEVLP